MPLLLIVLTHRTQHDQPDQVPDPVVSGPQFTHDLISARAITNFKLSPECVGQQFFSQTTFELVLPGQQQLSKFSHGSESVSARKFAGSIDRRPVSVLISPSTNGIEVFESKPRRINSLMTLCAGRQ